MPAIGSSGGVPIPAHHRFPHDAPRQAAEPIFQEAGDRDTAATKRKMRPRDTHWVSYRGDSWHLGRQAGAEFTHDRPIAAVGGDPDHLDDHLIAGRGPIFFNSQRQLGRNPRRDNSFFLFSEPGCF